MKIEHVALWTENLDRLKEFYVRFFHGKAGGKYTNPRTKFESYFISFEDGTRLEIMTRPSNQRCMGDTEEFKTGYSHLAFSTGSREAVDELTETLKAGGFEVVGEPRETGDGYYESCVLDPDGNRVEITV